MPVMATAPGPGRSAAASTSELKVNGMQKMLTSVDGAPGPPTVSGPEGEPASTIVRAVFVFVNAPEVRWPQLLKPPAPCVWPAQSAFDVQGIGRHGAAGLHGAPVVPVFPVQTPPVGLPPQRRANALSDLFLQIGLFYVAIRVQWNLQLKSTLQRKRLQIGSLFLHHIKSVTIENTH